MIKQNVLIKSFLIIIMSKREIIEEIRQLPSLELYENILTTLHSIKRQLLILDNRIDKIETMMRYKDSLETNRHIRRYAMHKEGPIKFIPNSSRTSRMNCDFNSIELN